MKKQNGDKRVYTEGIAVQGKAAKWLDNFWYHYKWITIGVAFFLVVAIICTAQMCTKKKNDVIVVYAGRNQLSAEQAQNIGAALEAICPGDFDGDGEISADLRDFCILSETQMRESMAGTDEDGNPSRVNGNYYAEQKKTYENYIQTGDVSVLMLDMELYEALAANNRLERLEDVLGYKPEGAVGEYGVSLGSTAFYNDYGVMKYIPDDTVVCILKPYVFGKNSKDRVFENEKQMFVQIVKEKA